MKICNNCENHNEDASLFCEHCGNKIIEQKPIEKCNQCGIQKESDARFCENCGYSFNEIKDNQNKIESTETCNHINREPQNQQVAQQPMSKKNKIILSLLLVILLAGGGSYTFFNQKFSKSNQIKDIITAVNKKDTSFLSKRMVSTDPSLIISKENIMPMLSYFEDNKDAIHLLQDSFEKSKSFQGLSIKEKGKQAFFFPKYNVEVSPIYTIIISNVKDSKVEMNGVNLFTTDSTEFEKKIGPLFPGKYEFKASIKDEKEVIEDTYNLLPDSEEDLSIIDLSFVMITIPIQSNMKQAKIILNNKEIGELKEGKAEIGPLLWNDHLNIQLSKKTDAGELKTDIQELKKTDINDSDLRISTVYLDFKTADEYDIKAGLQLFYDEFENAVTSTNDYSASDFANKFYEDGENNNSFSGIKDYITWCRERSAKKEYTGVSFNLNVKNVEPIAENIYKVKYNVVYRTTYPYETKKIPRIEGFDYTDVTIKLEQDIETFDVTDFKFIDMGDGGKKVEDNNANE